MLDNGQVAIKLGRPIETYGGYKDPSGAFFALLELQGKNKTIRSIESIYQTEKSIYESDPEGYFKAKYMELCNQYLDKELFILFHAKACFTDSERKCLCRDVGYRNWKLLFLESGRWAAIDTDRKYVRILDEDLCEL